MKRRLGVGVGVGAPNIIYHQYIQSRNISNWDQLTGQFSPENDPPQPTNNSTALSSAFDTSNVDDVSSSLIESAR